MATPEEQLNSAIWQAEMRYPGQPLPTNDYYIEHAKKEIAAEKHAQWHRDFSARQNQIMTDSSSRNSSSSQYIANGNPLSAILLFFGVFVVIGLAHSLWKLNYAQLFNNARNTAAIFSVAVHNRIKDDKFDDTAIKQTKLLGESFPNTLGKGGEMLALEKHLTQKLQVPRDLVEAFTQRYRQTMLSVPAVGEVTVKSLSPLEYFNVFVNKGGRSTRMALWASIEPGIFGKGQRTTICFIDDIAKKHSSLRSAFGHTYWIPKATNSEEAVADCLHAGKTGDPKSVSHGIIIDNTFHDSPLQKSLSKQKK